MQVSWLKKYNINVSKKDKLNHTYRVCAGGNKKHLRQNVREMSKKSMDFSALYAINTHKYDQLCIIKMLELHTNVIELQFDMTQDTGPPFIQVSYFTVKE